MAPRRVPVVRGFGLGLALEALSARARPIIGGLGERDAALTERVLRARFLGMGKEA